MSILKRLFGGGSRDTAAKSAIQPVLYEGYRIYPEPMSVEGQYRIAARIELEEDGQTRTHRLIRADLIREYDEAVAASLRKARQMIDEQGKSLFRWGSI